MRRLGLVLAVAASCLVTVLVAADRNDRVYAASWVNGHLDTVTINKTLGTLYVTGWAATDDFPTTPLGVRVIVNGKRTIPNFRIANEWRPDVVTHYPQYSPDHGFSFTVPAPETPPGTSYTVRAEAQNSGTYNNLTGAFSYSMTSAPDKLFLGGGWLFNPGASVNLKYWRSSAVGYNAYTPDVAWAANKWDATATRLNLTYDSTVNNAKIRFYEITGNGDNRAFSSHVPCYISCTYDLVYVYFDRTAMPPDTDDDFQKKIAAHELGHAFGLDHPATTSASSVMIIGSPSSSTTNAVRDPSSADTTRFINLHPQSFFDSP